MKVEVGLAGRDGGHKLPRSHAHLYPQLKLQASCSNDLWARLAYALGVHVARFYATVAASEHGSDALRAPFPTSGVTWPARITVDASCSTGEPAVSVAVGDDAGLRAAIAMRRAGERADAAFRDKLVKFNKKHGYP